MNGLKARRVELSEFFRRQFSAEEATGYTPVDIPVSVAERCWHIYGDLRLLSELEAPPDSALAKKLLKVLEHYSHAADAAAEVVGGHLIEVQGQRVHVLLPDDHQNPWRPVAFARAFTAAVYSKVARTVGKHFQGFSMACDYGDAVLVRSSFAGVLSEVSLGDSANQPAKRMGRTPGVPARHLSIPSRYRIQGTQRLVKGWQELNLEAVRVPVTSELRELEAAVRDVISDEPDEGDIEFAVPRFRGSGLTYAGSKPFQTFGFCMRADLDGFSARVRSAQNSRNPEAIAQLAHDIHNLMNQAEGFAKNFGKPVTPLPWAGDCANLLFPAETRMEHLADMKVIPVRASVEWTKHVSQGALFGREGGAVAWSIGIAGDESEPAYNSNGNLLVATIGSRRRPFPVGIGPGVKWSLAGEQANGLGAEETALFKPNLQTLEPPLRKVFESFCDQDGKENGNFEKARHRDLEEALDQHKRDRIKEISTVGIASEAGYTVVKPRSYWND